MHGTRSKYRAGFLRILYPRVRQSRQSEISVGGATNNQRALSKNVIANYVFKERFTCTL